MYYIEVLILAHISPEQHDNYRCKFIITGKGYFMMNRIAEIKNENNFVEILSMSYI